MNRSLNITNGDGAGNIIKESTVPGDVLPWRDPMHHGPFPAGLDLEATSVVRAKYLSGGDKYLESEIIRGFTQRDDHLRNSYEYEEIILWFEHDLLDQLQLLQLLDFFSRVESNNTTLAIICIDQFDGVVPFRGIGGLNPNQIESLIEKRHSLTSRQLALGQKIWNEFRAPAPTAIENFIKSGNDTLPFLRPALRRLLEEFPWCRDGLTRTERQILSLINSGESQPRELFIKNMNMETALFIGDQPTYRCLEDLSSSASPLISCSDGTSFHYSFNDKQSLESTLEQRVCLTQAGKDVLQGNAHGDEFLERDFWLGGVHLKSDGVYWHWDSALECCVR